MRSCAEDAFKNPTHDQLEDSIVCLVSSYRSHIRGLSSPQTRARSYSDLCSLALIAKSAET